MWFDDLVGNFDGVSTSVWVRDLNENTLCIRMSLEHVARILEGSAGKINGVALSCKDLGGETRQSGLPRVKAVPSVIHECI